MQHEVSAVLLKSVGEFGVNATWVVDVGGIEASSNEFLIETGSVQWDFEQLNVQTFDRYVSSAMVQVVPEEKYFTGATQEISGIEYAITEQEEEA